MYRILFKRCFPTFSRAQNKLKTSYGEVILKSNPTYRSGAENIKIININFAGVLFIQIYLNVKYNTVKFLMSEEFPFFVINLYFVGKTRAFIVKILN